MYIHIAEMLARNARMYPDEVALIERIPAESRRREITWQQFDERANRFANILTEKGVKKGAKVVHLMYNSIVFMEEEKCTGCRLCVEACPYNAMTFDMERNVAMKCNLCYHRVDYGLIPACADNVCLAHCIYFGDPDDIQRQINEKHLNRKKE